MKTSFTLTTTLALFASRVLGLQINTPPTVFFCQPQQLVWSGGSPPYWPFIIPGGLPSAPALKQFDQTDSTQLTWHVDIPAGTTITLGIRDSTGEIQYSGETTIQPGSCPSGVQAPVASAPAPGVASTPAASPAPAASTPAATGSVGPNPSVMTSNTVGLQSDSVARSSGFSTARPSVSAAATPSGRSDNSATISAPKALGMAGVLGLMGFMAL